jgi:hypothetical protein
MTSQELNDFLDVHRNIEWHDENDEVLFRNTMLPWYQEDTNRATKITKQKLDELTTEDLLSSINRGLEVEHITRVTGYFAKTRSFNPGKMGEFKDRYRTEIG